VSNNAMFELADRLKELREAKKAVEEELKSINAEIDEVEYRLSELMISSETQNFTRAGTMFCLFNDNKSQCCRRHEGGTV
jgi:predicted nuclease with TOPRIM domain